VSLREQANEREVHRAPLAPQDELDLAGQRVEGVLEGRVRLRSDLHE
jgi:hypothetical protein